MVFGKKISTDVVNFLFYLPGKAVRRGYPRGEEGNVKGGGGGVIALRPAKKRTDHRPEKEEEKKLSGNRGCTIYPGRTRPQKRPTKNAFPAFLHGQYSREIPFLTASKGTRPKSLPSKFDLKRNRSRSPKIRTVRSIPQSFDWEKKRGGRKRGREERAYRGNNAHISVERDNEIKITQAENTDSLYFDRYVPCLFLSLTLEK